MNEMKRMMKGEMDQIHEQLDQLSLTKWISHNTLLMDIKEGKFNQGKVELKMMNIIMKALMKMRIKILA